MTMQKNFKQVFKYTLQLTQTGPSTLFKQNDDKFTNYSFTMLLN